jgi:hypothetical protein
VNKARWSPSESIFAKRSGKETEVDLHSGLYDISIDHWQLIKGIEEKPGHGKYSGDLGHHCSDSDTFEWDVNDATHLI